jgi:hypothetical protein
MISLCISILTTRVKYDEVDINAKYANIQVKATQILGNDFKECSGLLEEFHRTIEVDGATEWEGATVSQVCLAEGTTVFVRLRDIASSILEYRSVEGYAEGNEEVWNSKIQDLLATVLSFAGEPFICAAEIFFSEAPPGEPFVFAGASVQDISGVSWPNSYIFPYSEQSSSERRSLQLGSRTQLAFASKSYGQLEDTRDRCFTEETKTLSQDCFSETGSQQNLAFIQCRMDGMGEAHLVCNTRHIYEPLLQSVELVFGEQPSKGFICGIKEAVVEDGKRLPGSCCLDAPYEMSGDEWGRPVSHNHATQH